MMNSQAFSKIWIVIILIALITSGFLAYQYWWVPKKVSTFLSFRSPEKPLVELHGKKAEGIAEKEQIIAEKEQIKKEMVTEAGKYPGAGGGRVRIEENPYHQEIGMS